MDPDRRLFSKIRPQPDDPGGLPSERVTAILEDQRGGLWIGTNGGGLSRREDGSRQFIHFKHDPVDPNSIGSDVVNTLEEDAEGTIWVGTRGGGLSRLDPETGAIVRYRANASDSGTIGSDDVTSILATRDGSLIIGTRGAGLNRLDRNTGTVDRSNVLFPDAEWIHKANVSALYEDRHGRIWSGFADGGLLVLNRPTGGFTYFESQIEEPTTGPPGGPLEAILEDRDGTIWLGTTGGGLSRLDTESGRFKHYTSSNSRIPSSAVHGVLQDEQGFLWLSTNRGLTRLDPETEIFQTYGPTHGLEGIVFAPGTTEMGSEGNMYFGGLGGVTVFRPGAFSGSPHPPQVVLTELQVFRVPVRPHSGGPISVAMPVADQIVLLASQNLITIGFAALHFGDPEQNKAMVRLTGFDDEWRYLGTSRSATYTNLDPGEYTFQVLVSNSDGLWNQDGTSVDIRVLPHWYASTWARILFLLVALGLIVGLVELAMRLQRRRFERQRLATQAELQSKELERERLINERLREIDAIKTSFLANMGHEIRTPLSLIIGYAEMLEREVQGGAHELATSIHLGGQRLMETLNSLLDLAQLEAGTVRTNLQPLDLVGHVSQIVSLFKVQADERGIELEWDEERVERIQIVADEVGLHRVLVNLVGNAIKFTPHGSVSLYASQDDEWGVITITDTGIGIGADFMPHVFAEYRQESTGFGRLFPGSGLGLAISKRMVELMKGEISVTSSKGEGSTFTVRLPIHHGLDIVSEEETPKDQAPAEKGAEPVDSESTSDSAAREEPIAPSAE
jgi:signal transduction histidine kinase/streptogramin lyase